MSTYFIVINYVIFSRYEIKISTPQCMAVNKHCAVMGRTNLSG